MLAIIEAIIAINIKMIIIGTKKFVKELTSILINLLSVVGVFSLRNVY